MSWSGTPKATFAVLPENAIVKGNENADILASVATVEFGKILNRGDVLNTIMDFVHTQDSGSDLILHTCLDYYSYFMRCCGK